MTRNLSPPEAVNLLTSLIRGMCEHPCNVVIEHPSPAQQRFFPRLLIRPHSGDYGAICGRGGKIINALQYLGAQVRVEIRLEDSYIGERGGRSTFKQDPQYDEKSAVDFTKSLFRALAKRELSLQVVRDVDELRIGVVNTDLTPDELTLIKALSDVLLQWSFTKGFILKLRPKAFRNAVAAA